MTDEEVDPIDRDVDARVAAAVRFAVDSPEPAVDRLAADMHAVGSDAQFARMRPGARSARSG